MNNEQPTYYAIIPAKVRYAAITDGAKLLYGEITALTSSEGYCWASNDHFAKMYGVSNNTISRWITSLKELGVISVEMKYKKGTKQIEKRIIKIDDRYPQNWGEGIPKNGGRGTPKNGEESITGNSVLQISNTKELKDIVPFTEIIDYLNLRTGRKYRVTNDVKKPINARFSEGFNLQDFKDVIDKKCIEWINDDKMRKYLQPSTLFGTKFQNYLNQEVGQKSSGLQFDNEGNML